jgi:hypothetical protein
MRESCSGVAEFEGLINRSGKAACDGENAYANCGRDSFDD